MLAWRRSAESLYPAQLFSEPVDYYCALATDVTNTYMDVDIQQTSSLLTMEISSRHDDVAEAQKQLLGQIAITGRTFLSETLAATAYSTAYEAFSEDAKNQNSNQRDLLAGLVQQKYDSNPELETELDIATIIDQTLVDIWFNRPLMIRRELIKNVAKETFYKPYTVGKVIDHMLNYETPILLRTTDKRVVFGAVGVGIIETTRIENEGLDALASTTPAVHALCKGFFKALLN